MITESLNVIANAIAVKAATDAALARDIANSFSRLVNGVNVFLVLAGIGIIIRAIASFKK